MAQGRCRELVSLAKDLPEAAGITHLFAGLFPKVLGTHFPNLIFGFSPLMPQSGSSHRSRALATMRHQAAPGRSRSISTTSPANRRIDRLQQRHGLVVDTRPPAFSRSGHVQGLDRVLK